MFGLLSRCSTARRSHEGFEHWQEYDIQAIAVRQAACNQDRQTLQDTQTIPTGLYRFML